MDYYFWTSADISVKTTLYSVISSKHIADMIKTANGKLPSNVNIIETQLIDTKVAENETLIRVVSYFPITEKVKYTLIHVTPVPLKHPDGTFQSLATIQYFLGIDYNNER